MSERGATLQQRWAAQQQAVVWCRFGWYSQPQSLVPCNGGEMSLPCQLGALAGPQWTCRRMMHLSWCLSRPLQPQDACGSAASSRACPVGVGQLRSVRQATTACWPGTSPAHPDFFTPHHVDKQWQHGTPQPSTPACERRATICLTGLGWAHPSLSPAGDYQTQLHHQQTALWGAVAGAASSTACTCNQR